MPLLILHATNMDDAAVAIKRYLSVTFTVAIILFVTAAIGVLLNRIVLAQDASVLALVFLGATAAYWNALKVINRNR